MRPNDIITGLDIGTTKICTLVARENAPGQLSILGVGIEPSQGIRKGVVVDLSAASQAVSRSIEKAERDRARHYAERTVSLATALAPRLGYGPAAEIVKASLRTGRPIVELAVELGGLSPAEARRILDPARLTRPGRA